MTLRRYFVLLTITGTFFHLPGCTEDNNGVAPPMRDSGVAEGGFQTDTGTIADQGASPADASPPTPDSCVPADGWPLDGLGPESARKETDQSGKLWHLEDWPDCSRPYPKDLVQRETWYELSWGESWFKEEYRSYLSSPGNWTWEEWAIIPDGKIYAGNEDSKGKSQAIAFAPGGGATVTDVYATADYAFFHVDPQTKAITVIGNPSEAGLVDGLAEDARLKPTKSRFSHWHTLDPVTGRVFFVQFLEKSRLLLRFIEKLLPYEVAGEQLLLPAILDHEDLYAELSVPEGGPIKKVYDGAQRAAPSFVVRTVPGEFAALPGLHLWGNRVLLSPDGSRAIMEKTPTWPRTLNQLFWFDTSTGADLGLIPVPSQVPPGIISDAHHAINARFDPFVYISRHTGATGGPGKMFRFSTATGALEMLYDSTTLWPQDNAKRPDGYRELKEELSSTHDGPADAITLLFTTTCFQTQSPRTGAVITGGWDAAGLRRYHDGFVTSLVAHSQMGMNGGRPEWGSDQVAAFGSLQSAPEIAPNGDVYLTSCQEEAVFTDELRINGTRIIRLSRTDWPANQPINGYANQHFSPDQRRQAMKSHGQRALDQELNK